MRHPKSLQWQGVCMQSADCRIVCRLLRCQALIPEPSCRYTASVQLASKVIDTEAKLRATLLHELCHVATWLLPPHVAKVGSQITSNGCPSVA